MPAVLTLTLVCLLALGTIILTATVNGRPTPRSYEIETAAAVRLAYQYRGDSSNSSSACSLKFFLQAAEAAPYNAQSNDTTPTVQFDLCPLVVASQRSPITIEHETSLASGAERTPGADGSEEKKTVSYEFLMGGQGEDHGSRESRCTRGTWICKKTLYDRPTNKPPCSRPIQVAGGEAVPLEQNATATYDGVSLSVRLQGGYRRGRRQSALIHFLCGDASSDAKPVFVSSRNGVHEFTWASPYACPLPALTQSHPTPLEKPSTFRIDTAEGVFTANEDSVDEGSGDDSETDEQNLIDTHPIASRPHRPLPTIIILTGTAILVVAYVITSPPAYLRRMLHAGARKFRVGEGLLVRWAQEDMGVLGNGGEGELDMMVNAEAMNDDGYADIVTTDVSEVRDGQKKTSMFGYAYGLGHKMGRWGKTKSKSKTYKSEQIPLRPSPGMGSRVGKWQAGMYGSIAR